MREAAWVISAGAATVIGALFHLHWQRSRDRFFAYFAAAFWALAASSVILLAGHGGGESRPSAYVVRLVSFLLIIVAIADKNWPRREQAEHRSPFDAEPGDW